jgi:hypothetical protein
LNVKEPKDILHYGSVPINEAAELHPLGEPSKNKDQKDGDAFLEIRGGISLLDDTYMKHVIFRDAAIIYKGGPMELDGVYFINCTFVLPNNPHGQQFASAFLTYAVPLQFSIA